MSSTNKTTNYELSQFIGSDKPAWLSDYNGDMGKIDASIHTAQTTATGADGKATANASAIGTLSSLTTEAKTNLVAAVNEVNTAAGTALNTATTAAGNATQAKTEADALAAYLTMTIQDVAANNIVAASGTLSSQVVSIAQNNTNSLGKVYGTIIHNTGSTNGQQTITFNIDSGIHPTTDFTIRPAGFAQVVNSNPSGFSHGNIISMTFKTDGKIVLKYYADFANSRYSLVLWPCLYFFKDFGDVESE